MRACVACVCVDLSNLDALTHARAQAQTYIRREPSLARTHANTHASTQTRKHALWHAHTQARTENLSFSLSLSLSLSLSRSLSLSSFSISFSLSPPFFSRSLCHTHARTHTRAHALHTRYTVPTRARARTHTHTHTTHTHTRTHVHTHACTQARMHASTPPGQSHVARALMETHRPLASAAHRHPIRCRTSGPSLDPILRDRVIATATRRVSSPTLVAPGLMLDNFRAHGQSCVPSTRRAPSPMQTRSAAPVAFADFWHRVSLTGRHSRGPSLKADPAAPVAFGDAAGARHCAAEVPPADRGGGGETESGAARAPVRYTQQLRGTLKAGVHCWWHVGRNGPGAPHAPPAGRKVPSGHAEHSDVPAKGSLSLALPLSLSPSLSLSPISIYLSIYIYVYSRVAVCRAGEDVPALGIDHSLHRRPQRRRIVQEGRQRSRKHPPQVAHLCPGPSGHGGAARRRWPTCVPARGR